MIASKKIIDKISDRCLYDEPLKKFLLNLFDFETQEKGWWKNNYEKLIDHCMKEESKNENSKNNL